MKPDEILRKLGLNKAVIASHGKVTKQVLPPSYNKHKILNVMKGLNSNGELRKRPDITRNDGLRKLRQELGV